MEAATTRQNPIDGLRRFLGTRRGSFLVAAIAAALAALVLAVYLNNYKNDVRGGVTPTQVMIADRLIPAGTSGAAVAADSPFRLSTIAQDDVKAGALTDAAALSGKTATRDILPGQQIVAADFVAGADPLRGQISGTQRVISIPVGTAQGLIGNLRPGDRVDVFASFTGGNNGAGVLRTIAQNVLVLGVPSAETKNTQAAMLRLTDVQAARFAYASDNAKIWFALRPPTGGQSSRPATVNAQTVVGPRARSLP